MSDDNLGYLVVVGSLIVFVLGLAVLELRRLADAAWRLVEHFERGDAPTGEPR